MADDVVPKDATQISELRAMFCEQSLLNKADGSANFVQGDTKVIAAAYGPVEVRVNKELIDKATLEVVFRPKVGLPGCAEKLLEGIIRNSCEPIVLTSLHPRASMTIVIQVVQDSGSLLSCAVNAACMAMVDAGFPMKCLVCAVTCAVNDTGDIQLDPTLQLEKEASAVLTFAFDSINQNLMTSTTAGTCSIEQYNKCLAACQTAVEKILQFYRQSVERKLSRDAKYMDLNVEPWDT